MRKHTRTALLAIAALLSLPALQALADEAEGTLDKVARIVRVFGMVNAAPDFGDHPKVINGCSDLFGDVFGDAGKHDGAMAD